MSSKDPRVAFENKHRETHTFSQTRTHKAQTHASA